MLFAPFYLSSGHTILKNHSLSKMWQLFLENSDLAASISVENSLAGDVRCERPQRRGVGRQADPRYRHDAPGSGHISRGRCPGWPDPGATRARAQPGVCPGVGPSQRRRCPGVGREKRKKNLFFRDSDLAEFLDY